MNERSRRDPSHALTLVSVAAQICAVAIVLGLILAAVPPGRVWLFWLAYVPGICASLLGLGCGVLAFLGAGLEPRWQWRLGRRAVAISACVVAILVSCVIFPTSMPEDRHRMLQVRAHMYPIIRALEQYADAHEESYPDKGLWQLLEGQYLTEDDVDGYQGFARTGSGPRPTTQGIGKVPRRVVLFPGTSRSRSPTDRRPVMVVDGYTDGDDYYITVYYNTGVTKTVAY